MKYSYKDCMKIVKKKLIGKLERACIAKLYKRKCAHEVVVGLH
jgi:hypothetical protein